MCEHRLEVHRFGKLFGNRVFEASTKHDRWRPFEETILCTVFLFVTKQCWPMVKFKSLYFVNIESLDDDSNWERMNWL